MNARREQTPPRGLFITFEGVEGSGKSTQIQLLEQHLTSKGFDVEVTREPGGTPLAEQIRELLLAPGNTALSHTAEILLYEAARAQHVDERIAPALAAGRTILCDRFADSTTAYQGAGRAISRDIVLRLHEIATRGTWPDLTFVLDLPPELGLTRATSTQEPDRIERESLAFHERVREEFLSLAKEYPERIMVIDGSQEVDAIAAEIAQAVDALLEAP